MVDLSLLKTELEPLLLGFRGKVGVSLAYPLSPPSASPQMHLSGDEMFPSASLIKVAILCTLMEGVSTGEIDWAEPIPIMADRAGLRETGGVAYHLRNRTFLPLCEWIHLMICMSDNTATVILKDRIGQSRINAWLHQRHFKVTRVLNGAETDILGLREQEQEYGLGVTTPNEMVRLWTMIVREEIASPAACDRMIRLLSHQYWDDFLVGQIPPLVAKANMTGAIEDSRSDIALIVAPLGTYLLSVFTKRQQDTRWDWDNEGDTLLRQISRLVWKHHAPGVSWEPPAGSEAFYPISG